MLPPQLSELAQSATIQPGLLEATGAETRNAKGHRNPPAFESQLGRATTYKVQRKLHSAWGGGPPDQKPSSNGCQLPTPATSKPEEASRLKDPVPPKPWERTDLEQEFARCDGRRESPGRWPLAMPTRTHLRAAEGSFLNDQGLTRGEGTFPCPPRLSPSGSRPEQSNRADTGSLLSVTTPSPTLQAERGAAGQRPFGRPLRTRH